LTRFRVIDIARQRRMHPAIFRVGIDYWPTLFADDPVRHMEAHAVRAGFAGLQIRVVPTTRPKASPLILPDRRIIRG
jgi:hypothetical protein